MRGKTTLLLLSLMCHMVATEEGEQGEDLDLLAELPLDELLAHKKLMTCDNSSVAENMPEAMPLINRDILLEKDIKIKGIHRSPVRKTFYEDYDEKEHVHKKKEKHKVHDILNTSITALSYLAFGGYLLCMIVGSLREKRRRFMMAYPAAYGAAHGPQHNNHLAHILQQHMNRRPIRVKFPTVSFNHGGRRRRKRSNRPRDGYPGEDGTFSIVDVIDLGKVFSGMGGDRD